MRRAVVGSARWGTTGASTRWSRRVNVPNEKPKRPVAVGVRRPGETDEEYRERLALALRQVIA